jgi:hypothetical protein
MYIGELCPIVFDCRCGVGGVGIMSDQWCSVVSSGEVRPDDADNRVVYPIEVLVMVNPRVVGEGPLN